MSPKEDEITFFVYADQFLFAAEELENSNNPAKVSTASYYLYGHSLELAYKAYLYKNDFSIKQLKDIGHDLEKGLMECINTNIENFLDINEKYHNVVKGINKYYSKKEFEYMTRIAKTFPNDWEIKDTVKKTVSSVHNAIANYAL